MTEVPNTVCVIEDNNAIRKLYAIILKKNKFDVAEFEEGNPAVEWLKEHKPLVVICDDMLPDTNGEQVLKHIRAMEHGNELVVIAVTGFAQSSDRDRYLAMGFNSYIPKPINTGSFVSEIMDVVNAHK